MEEMEEKRREKEQVVSMCEAIWCCLHIHQSGSCPDTHPFKLVAVCLVVSAQTAHY